MNLGRLLLGGAALALSALVSQAQTPFITGYALNNPPLRNDYSNFVGTKFTVGASALPVTSLGRVCVTGNSQTHTVKFVLASSGVDVPGGSTTVNLAGCTAGQFVYAAPASPVTLAANTTYYLLSSEVAGGDRWYDSGRVTATSDAAVNSSVYFDGTNYISYNGPNTSYVPPNFEYTPPSSATFVTGYDSSRPLRNDYSGFVGMELTVGSTPLTVTELGRICVAGNSQVHTVKFALVSTGVDVPGASAAVNTAGCSPGTYVFAPPASTVTLAANTAYYLTSQEFSGGDKWYDQGHIATTSAAAVNNAVYTRGANYVTIGSANTSYVPPNFQYTSGAACSGGTISVTVGTNPTGLSFTVDSTTYTTTQTFNWVCGSAHTISTTSPQNVSGGSQEAFSNWSDGGAISHTVMPTTSTTYTANFTTQYLLTLTVNPSGGGTISANPPSSSGYYDAGTVVQLTANPNSGFVFDHYSGDLSGSMNPQSITLSQPRSVTANFAMVTTQPAHFVTGYALNNPPLRNDFSGFVGMRLTVGNNPLSVTSVGRVCVAGNSQTHIVKFVLVSTGKDLPGTAAGVNTAGCTAGQFVYTALSAPVTLLANTMYYFVSQEFAGGDRWYDQGSISTTNVAAVDSSAYSNGGSYISINSANTSYVPPDFEYNMLPPDSTSAFVTAYALNNPPLRNDFSGFVGMKLTIGSTALSAVSLGRICVAGNGMSHLVEFVNAANNAVVGSVTVNLAGCTPGQFVYASPVDPIHLQAGATYYLASQEVSGGDKWYDLGAIATSNAATVNSSIYFYNGNWITNGGPNTSYVPPNFIYAPQGSPIIEVSPSRAPNVFGSPSWPGYLMNAIHALETSMTAIGDPNSDPKAYFQVSMENERQNIVSGFPSWLGFTPPSGPFANELGNRLHFGLRVIGNGQQFSLSELAFDMESSDTADTFQFAGDFSDPTDSSNDYSNAIVGLNYGPDRMKGTADDFYVMSGPPTQVVDELFYVGVGNAIAPEDLGCTGSNQAMLDCVAAYYQSISPFNLSTTYTLNSSTPVKGSGVVAFASSQSSGGAVTIDTGALTAQTGNSQAETVRPVSMAVKASTYK